MNFAKRLLTLTGMTALAVIAMVVVTPKAVHVVAATLVQITNTAANPVPNRDVDNPAAQPFAATLCQELGTYVNDCLSSSGAVSDQFVAPGSLCTGHTVGRLVLEFASGSCVATATQVYDGAIVQRHDRERRVDSGGWQSESAIFLRATRAHVR